MYFSLIITYLETTSHVKSQATDLILFLRVVVNELNRVPILFRLLVVDIALTSYLLTSLSFPLKKSSMSYRHITSLEYLFCNASYPTSINVRPIVFLVVSCLVYINDLFPLSAPQWLWSFKHLQVLFCLCMNGNLLKWRFFFTLIEVHRFFMESRLSPVASLV